jgi:hypothetical protein
MTGNDEKKPHKRHGGPDVLEDMEDTGSYNRYGCTDLMTQIRQAERLPQEVPYPYLPVDEPRVELNVMAGELPSAG